MATVEEFTAFITSERPSLFGWFRKRAGSQSADDLTQITCLDLFRHLGTIDNLCKKLLYETATRRLIDHIRKSQRTPEPAPEEAMLTIAEPRPGPETLAEWRDTIHQEMAKRSLETRKLLWWRARGYTEREIAEVLKLKVGAVNKRASRARSLQQPTRKFHGQEIRRAAMEIAKRKGRVTTATVAKLTGLHQNVVGNHLRKLEADGLLMTCGVEVSIDMGCNGTPRWVYAPTARLLRIKIA